jgi:hypothetical protein
MIIQKLALNDILNLRQVNTGTLSAVHSNLHKRYLNSAMMHKTISIGNEDGDIYSAMGTFLGDLKYTNLPIAKFRLTIGDKGEHVFRDGRIQEFAETFGSRIVSLSIDSFWGCGTFEERKFYSKLTQLKYLTIQNVLPSSYRLSWLERSQAIPAELCRKITSINIVEEICCHWKHPTCFDIIERCTQLEQLTVPLLKRSPQLDPFTGTCVTEDEILYLLVDSLETREKLGYQHISTICFDGMDTFDSLDGGNHISWKRFVQYISRNPNITLHNVDMEMIELLEQTKHCGGQTVADCVHSLKAIGSWTMSIEFKNIRRIQDMHCGKQILLWSGGCVDQFGNRFHPEWPYLDCVSVKVIQKVH